MCSWVLSIGCHKPSQSASLDRDWTGSVTIAHSKSGIVSGVEVYRWHDTIFALQPQGGGVAKCFLKNSDDNSWAEVPFTGVPRGYHWYRPATDQNGERLFFEASYVENDQLVINALVGQLEVKEGLAVRNVSEEKWVTDKKSLFGETGPNVKLAEPGKREWPGLGIGAIDGQNLYVPFALGGIEITYRGKQIIIDGSKGPFSSGVFYSADSGKTWQVERICGSGGNPSVCGSEGLCYFFVVREERDESPKLWFTSRSATGGSWADLSVVAKTASSAYVVVPQKDNVHLCWLDCRHEKRRSNPVYPRQGNYEVAYCQRKDSDTKWSKDVILSEGLLYSFSPTMSVEGDKVVVAWSGIQTAGDWHTSNNPNDIYCRTSKDGGKTWDKLLKVTDAAKDGITSGDPQVVLQNGIIHLTYIQGKLDFTQESPGLTKLNQPPWPILYQQRPFPN